MGQPAARVGDITSHGTPLGPGPGGGLAHGVSFS